jgi:hypothetical protein
MEDYEEAFNEYYNFRIGTRRAYHALIPERRLKEEKRFHRLIIEGIIVVDTKPGGVPWPEFVPAGEPERIWRATEGQDPRWRVVCRRFIWEEGDGKPLKKERLRKRLDYAQIMWGRVRRLIHR